MRLYAVADHDPHHYAETLRGGYPDESGRFGLHVSADPPKSDEVWWEMNLQGHYVGHVFEIELPHSEKELEPYRADEHPDYPRWFLPWYVVANHPVKIMTYHVSHEIMGAWKPEEQSRRQADFLALGPSQEPK